MALLPTEHGAATIPCHGPRMDFPTGGEERMALPTMLQPPVINNKATTTMTMEPWCHSNSKHQHFTVPLHLAALLVVEDTISLPRDTDLPLPLFRMAILPMAWPPGDHQLVNIIPILEDTQTPLFFQHRMRQPAILLFRPPVASIRVETPP